MKRKTIGFAALIAVAGIGAVATFAHFGGDMISAGSDSHAAENKQTTVAPPPTVTVIRPIMRQFTATVRISGSLVPRDEVLVAPQIEGQRIRALHVEQGDTVRKGQLLATLATENLNALLAQNAAALARADAAIAQARSSITQADARLTEAAAALVRAKPLNRSGYLSRSNLDQRQSAATTARAALAIAKDSLKLAESEKAQVQAQRRELIWRQSRTQVKSPVDGLVLSRSAKIGAIATAVGEPLFRIAKAGEIEFEGEATSEQMPLLAHSQKARLTVAGAADVTGTVRLVAPRIDPTTRLGIVRIFIGANNHLRVGTFATGIIETGQAFGKAIPANAVMRDDDGAYVQVAVGKRVQKRRLILGLTDSGYVEVREGLSGDDLVIAKAGTFLSNGETIRPILPKSAPPPSDRRPTAG